ncbi:hypothetical protein BDAP_002181 [Binucleata daphniae]
MLLFSLFPVIFTKKIVLAPKKVFKFEASIKKDELFKFEFHEEKDSKVHCTIIDDLNRTILDTTNNYIVVHWSPNRDSTQFFKFENTTSAPMSIYFRTPDVNKEMFNAIGPITDKDILAEFDSALKRNIQEQRTYLEGMTEHEKMTKNTRRVVGWLVIIEIISCAGFIWYLHKKTISLFENRIKK